MVVHFRRKSPPTTPVGIQVKDIETVDSHKYLGVHLNKKLDWATNTDMLYEKGQSPHLLRTLKSFGVCRTLLKTFCDSVVASALFYTVVCWGGGCTDRDRKEIVKLVRRTASVLGCPLDFVETVGERRMLAKLTSIMEKPCHSLHESVAGLSSSFSQRLKQPRCKKERFCRSFILKAIRLCNAS